MLITIDTNEAKKEALEFFEKLNSVKILVNVNWESRFLSLNLEQVLSELSEQYIKSMLKIGVVI